jgi:hypothetical protein
MCWSWRLLLAMPIVTFNRRDLRSSELRSTRGRNAQATMILDRLTGTIGSARV